MAAPVPELRPLSASVAVCGQTSGCSCLLSRLHTRLQIVCVSSEETVLLCWHMNFIPPWRGAEKRISGRLKKKKEKKSRHAWQQQYKNSSYHTCSSGPVWCDKNHHIGWEAWQTVGRQAQTQHSPKDISFSWHTMFCWAEKEQHLHLTECFQWWHTCTFNTVHYSIQRVTFSIWFSVS